MKSLLSRKFKHILFDDIHSTKVVKQSLRSCDFLKL